MASEPTSNPLSAAANPPETVLHRREGRPVRQHHALRSQLLPIARPHRQNEPWIERDRAMIDPLRSIGIEKGKPFAPNAATQAILIDGHRRGQGPPGTTLLTPASHPSGKRSRWTLPAPPGPIDGQGTTYAKHDATRVERVTVVSIGRSLAVDGFGGPQAQRLLSQKGGKPGVIALFQEGLGLADGRDEQSLAWPRSARRVCPSRCQSSEAADPSSPGRARSRARPTTRSSDRRSEIVAHGAVVWDVLRVGEDCLRGIGGRGQRIDFGSLAIGDRRGNVGVAMAVQIRA